MILHCISGLPRAGSTLLCNVLAQNPRFYATQTSGLLDVLFGVRNQWDSLLEMRAMDSRLSEQRKLAVLRGMVASFYADVDQPVVFDKSRGWLAHLELLQAVLERPPRVLVPVRDLRDVLASFEKLYRATSATRQLAAESANYLAFQSVEQRLETWTRFDQPVGLAYNRIKDALQRGWRPHLFFVDYDRLCTQAPAMAHRAGPGGGEIRRARTVVTRPGPGCHVPSVTCQVRKCHVSKVYTDAAMTHLVTQAHSDSFGQVTFYLDPGAYYLRRTKAGWSFTNPDMEIIA